MNRHVWQATALVPALLFGPAMSFAGNGHGGTAVHYGAGGGVPIVRGTAGFRGYSGVHPTMRGNAGTPRGLFPRPGQADVLRAANPNLLGPRVPLNGAAVNAALANRPIVNPFIYGWPFGLWGVGWSGPLWWAIGYPGWGIYDVPPSSYATTPPAQAAANHIAQGSRDFRAGRYVNALRQWQWALADDPFNPEILLLISQTLFALERYDDAAGTMQLAVMNLGATSRGLVVESFSQLYPDSGAYASQLRKLEAATAAKPNNPALRLLLGYHYGYLGYPQSAIRELDNALRLQPRSRVASMLRDTFINAARAPRDGRYTKTIMSVPQSTLRAMGLGDLEVMTDAEGRYVRGF
jgi:hypothetical protein